MKLFRELMRALRNRRYEQTEHGVLFTESKLSFENFFDIQKNNGPIEIFPNLVVDEWREAALDILFASGTQQTSFYLAPYAGNVSPTASWDASNFTANSTEFTNYDEAARQAWTPGSVDTSSYSIDNSSSKAVFTVGAGTQTTIWGVGLLTASAKSSTSGLLVAANKATSARDNLVDGDEITIGYTITLNDDS